MLIQRYAVYVVFIEYLPLSLAVHTVVPIWGERYCVHAYLYHVVPVSAHAYTVYMVYLSRFATYTASSVLKAQV